MPPGTEASEYGAYSVGDQDVSERRDENMKALDALSCNQLKTATSAAAARQYRDECLTREEQQVWDEEQHRKRWEKRQEQSEEERIKSEEENRKKQKELERKASEKPQRRHNP